MAFYTDKEYTNILNQLPKNYDELSFDKYRELSKYELEFGYKDEGDIYRLMEILVGIPALRLKDSLNIVKYTHLVEFLNKNLFGSQLDYKKKVLGIYRHKTINEITVDDFITLSKINDDIIFDDDQIVNYFNTFLVYDVKGEVRKPEFTLEEILEYPASECMSAFFLSMKMLEKYMRHASTKEARKVMKMKMKKLLAR